MSQRSQLCSRDGTCINLQWKADELDVGSDQSSITLLHLAAELGQVKVIAVLLSNGADIEALNGREETALLVATGWDYAGPSENRMGTIAALLKHGADQTRKGQCDMEPRELLSLAIEHGEATYDAACTSAGVAPLKSSEAM